MIKAHVMTVLLIFLGTGGVLLNGMNLPQVAVSLSLDNYQAELNLAELKNGSAPHGQIKEIILPSIAFSPGMPLDLTAYGKIMNAVSGMSLPVERVWLRLKLAPPAQGMQDKEIERGIANIVNELSNHGAFKYFGIILDADAGCSNDLVRLAVLSFSVSLKAARDDMQIAVFDTVAVAGGENIPAYVDRIILSGRDNRRLLMMQLARVHVGRPFSLLIREETGSDSRRDYLDGLLEFPDVTPDTFIIENAQPGGIQPLLTMIEGLMQRLPKFPEKTDGSLPFFKLVDENDSSLSQMVFTDASLSRAVIIAGVDGSGAAPRKLKFIPPGGENFKLTCYEPLESTGFQGIAISSTEIDWTQKYILVVAEKKQESGGSVGESVTVSARVGLGVEDIVARWQRYDTRQKKDIKNYLANTEMDMHFEPPNLGAGFDVSLHFRYFWNCDGTQYWEQTAQYLNGIKLPGKRSFPLPQLEPEQVVTQPLELNLVESYTYRLEENETIDGQECYVLSFRPRQGVKETLYTGKIWIDCATFRKVQFLLVQNNCSGSILGNTELQHFQLVSGPGGEFFNLLVKSEVEQKVLAAGREFLLERRYRFKDISINSSDFDARLQGAVKGKMPMFTETREGLREYVLEKNDTRKIKEKVASFIWSLVTGLLYDDTANFPIPFVGVSAIDYNFLKTGTQLSTLLVVPFLAVNLTKQYKGNLTLGSELAISAVPRNDRVYRDKVEIKEESLYIFSGSFGFRLGWRPVTDLSLTTSHYLVYEHFIAEKDTAPAFELPRNGFTVNSNLDFDYSRKGYRLTLSGSIFNRLGWEKWGSPGNMEGMQSTYAKFSGTFGKRFYLGSFTRIGADISYYSGFNLDRFSSYQPSLMSVPKIRGVASGSISLENIGVLSLNVGFTAFDLVRFDTYYNIARGCEYNVNDRKIDFQGLEFDFGTVGPWSSYVQGRLTYAVAGPIERYKSRWSVYLMMFIPFKK